MKTQMNFNFDNLTPDLMWQALASIGIRAQSGLLALNSYENRVYQFTDEEKIRYVVKFYRPCRWDEKQIQEEHNFLLELIEAEIPVAAPLIINNQSLHEYKGYLFSLFESVGGRSFEMDNLNQLESVGRYLGLIHQIGKKKKFQCRPSIEIENEIYQSKKTLIDSTLIPTSLETLFFDHFDKLTKEISIHWEQPKTNIRLHGDCHQGNILWRDHAIFVDFDDCKNGPAIQDFWMLLNGERSEKIIQLDILLESYNEFNDLNLNQLKLIEPLRGLRMINYMAWLTKRWQDPAFPAAFPWFREAQYWENKILEFQEQIILLNEQPLSLTPQW